ncbi:hypothetical protein BD324DRAFT_299776 [Kockovaella imperatae]|uniref:Uncharacterized protein n=1 Tax=Kockovaella imperatae TaxID=4999 RepID=A0A1Y1ULS7_9TREE|nr:hypothetical protein BD324DRAFT_299776 [Kockovaella imperatae]ORX38949.1 hypothetical protein BD324DRAFT_299776 [Kockovaella imperatae]
MIRRRPILQPDRSHTYQSTQESVLRTYQNNMTTTAAFSLEDEAGLAGRTVLSDLKTNQIPYDASDSDIDEARVFFQEAWPMILAGTPLSLPLTLSRGAALASRELRRSLGTLQLLSQADTGWGDEHVEHDTSSSKGKGKATWDPQSTGQSEGLTKKDTAAQRYKTLESCVAKLRDALCAWHVSLLTNPEKSKADFDDKPEFFQFLATEIANERLDPEGDYVALDEGAPGPSVGQGSAHLFLENPTDDFGDQSALLRWAMDYHDLFGNMDSLCKAEVLPHEHEMNVSALIPYVNNYNDRAAASLGFDTGGDASSDAIARGAGIAQTLGLKFEQGE